MSGAPPGWDSCWAGAGLAFSSGYWKSQRSPCISQQCQCAMATVPQIPEETLMRASWESFQVFNATLISKNCLIKHLQMVLFALWRNQVSWSLFAYSALPSALIKTSICLVGPASECSTGAKMLALLLVMISWNCPLKWKTCSWTSSLDWSSFFQCVKLILEFLSNNNLNLDFRNRRQTTLNNISSVSPYFYIDLGVLIIKICKLDNHFAHQS